VGNGDRAERQAANDNDENGEQSSFPPKTFALGAKMAFAQETQTDFGCGCFASIRSMQVRVNGPHLRLQSGLFPYYWGHLQLSGSFSFFFLIVFGWLPISGGFFKTAKGCYQLLRVGCIPHSYQ
jgi:hypothetical protein